MGGGEGVWFGSCSVFPTVRFWGEKSHKSTTLLCANPAGLFCSLMSPPSHIVSCTMLIATEVTPVGPRAASKGENVVPSDTNMVLQAIL